MIRWKNMVVGAVAFTGAHLVEAATWSTWIAPGSIYRPWFLNAGPAAALTAACLFAAAALASFARRTTPRESIVDGSNVAAGGIAAMMVTLAVAGPGTLFPIALFAGACINAASALAGALVGAAIRRLYR